MRLVSELRALARRIGRSVEARFLLAHRVEEGPGVSAVSPLAHEEGVRLGVRALASHRCPLCGRGFTAEEAAACVACPLLRRCGLVMCPHCGYEFAPS